MMLVALLLLWFQQPDPVWLCPVHTDVQSDAPGRCSIDQRPFELRMLRAIWACPMHSHIRGRQGDSCPECGMKLGAQVVEVVWSCASDPAFFQRKSGICPRDGKPLVEKEIPLAHGDHNPRHGGVFFMAADNFHHLEGTLTDGGEFRLYFYDNFTRPISAREFEARVGDQALTPSAEGSHLATRLPGSPVEVTAFVRLEKAGNEQRFDFIFPKQGEPPSPTAAPSKEFRIPATPDRIYREILEREKRIDFLMERGAWTQVFVPALEAKDLALALAGTGGAGSEELGLAVKTIVRAAWLLDTYGDLGDRTQLEPARQLLKTGIASLRSIYER